MSARFRGRIAVHALVLVLALGTQAGAGNSSKNKVHKMTNPYPVLYANSCCNSRTTVALTGKGAEAWRKKRPVETLGAPAHLLVAEKAVLIVTSQEVHCRSLSGDELWSQGKWPGCLAVLFGDALFVQLPQDQTHLAKVSVATGAVVSSAISVPAQGKEKLVFLGPSERGFIGCIYKPETQVLRDGRPTTASAQYGVFGKPYDNWDFTWVGEGLESFALSPLHVTEAKRLLVLVKSNIVVYDSEPTQRESNAVARLEYPVQMPSTASADGAGTIYITGTSEKQDWLVAVDLKGQTKWKWQCKEGFSASKYPPAVCPNGTVVALGRSSVLGVVDGSTAWEFSAELRTPEFVTVTADNSVLIAAGSTLFCTKNGKLVFKFDLDDTIVAPPVLDNGGSIYLLSPRDLVKVS